MTPLTNHRVVVFRHGGPDVLEIVDSALPEPGPGQVRLRTETAGVSAYDAMLRSAGFPGFPRPPFTPGVDVVMYGTASAHNHDLVRSLGATPIDYRTEDVVERVGAFTGDGVDAAFDQIGGARQLRRSYRTLRRGGRLVWFGVAASAKSGMKVIPLSLLARFTLQLIPDGKRVLTPPSVNSTWYHETLTTLLDLLASGRLAPVVAERIPLTEVARAHELLERGGHAGKIVLVAEGPS